MMERMTSTGEGRAFSVGASQVLVKVQDGDPQAAFSLIEWAMIPPRAPAPPRHVHREGSETFYVLEGEIDFLLADRTLRAGTGTCVHIPPGTVHTLANPGRRPARVLEFFVPGSLLGLVEEVGRVFAGSVPPDRGRLKAAFAEHASEIVE